MATAIHVGAMDRLPPLLFGKKDHDLEGRQVNAMSSVKHDFFFWRRSDEDSLPLNKLVFSHSWKGCDRLPKMLNVQRVGLYE